MFFRKPKISSVIPDNLHTAGEVLEDLADNIGLLKFNYRYTTHLSNILTQNVNVAFNQYLAAVPIENFPQIYVDYLKFKNSMVESNVKRLCEQFIALLNLFQTNCAKERWTVPGADVGKINKKIEEIVVDIKNTEKSALEIKPEESMSIRPY